MRAVNLLPAESRPGRGFRTGVDPVVIGGALLTAVVAIAVGGGFVIEHSHATAAEHQLDAARATLVRLTAQHTTTGPAGPPIVPTPDVVSEVPAWKDAVVSALSTRLALDTVLAQLGRVVPANVTITSLTIGSGSSSSSSPGTAGGLNIGGTAFTEDAVAQFLSRLSLVPQVTTASLTSTSVDPKSGVVTYSITAQMKGASTAFTTGTGGTTTTTTTTTTPSGSGA